MSLEHALRGLPTAPWLFLFVWSAGYGVAKLALESTAPLNLLAFRFVGATLALFPFVVIMRLDWSDCQRLSDCCSISAVEALFKRLSGFVVRGVSWTGGYTAF